MIILNCPKCAEAVTMASGVRASARVRCPLCQEEYLLSEALGKLPPSLIVLDAPDAAEEGERPLEPTWETSSESGEAESAASAFAFDSGRGSSSTATAGAAPHISARPRPKRKPKNPAIEGIKVVGGGIAGLVIAQLLLWWFPVTKYRRDPFELGPKLSKSWLGFLVSPDFKGDGSLLDDVGDDTADAQSKSRGESKNGGKGGAGGGLGADNPPYSEELGKTPVDWNAFNKSQQEGGEKTAPSKNKKKPDPADDDLILDDLTPKAPTDAGLGGDLKVDLAPAKPAPTKPTTPAKPAPPAKPASAGSDEKPDAPEEGAAEPKPAPEKPATKPAEPTEKPADEKPANEKPTDEKPATEKPADDKPADEKAAEQKPAETTEKPTDPAEAP